MLTIRRIEIDNFVCFHGIVIDPSTNTDRPLTVIRAENGSGKTTLLRAIRWGMYGEDGLPGNAETRARFSLHPASWKPAPDGVTTSVAIEFETDGSTRESPTIQGDTTVYELTRYVMTVGREPSSPGAPDFARIDERTQLMVREPDGSWSRHDAGVDAVTRQLLPWELRDFFVIDADEAADYVGGSENKVVPRRAVTKKTTDAVHALLGLSVFKDASARVARLAQKFGREATRAAGDADLDRRQAELDGLRTQRDELEAKVADSRRTLGDLTDRLHNARVSFEALVGDIGARDQLKVRMKENRERHEVLRDRRTRAVTQYAAELEAIDLFARFAVREARSVHRALQPLHESHAIPLRHLDFVRGLLDSGICVCGQKLTPGSSFQTTVVDVLEQTAGQAEHADHLSHVLDAANLLLSRQQGDWRTRCASRATAVADIDEELRDAENIRRDIDSRLDAIDDEQVQVRRGEIEAIESQIGRAQREQFIHTDELERVTRQVSELDKGIVRQRRQMRAAQDQEAYRETAGLVEDILNRAYSTIQREQVKELSVEMNRLFVKMAANLADDDSDTPDRRKATLKMISEVGIRSIEEVADEFEIFVLNSRGRHMPPTEINGASRRTIALAFVLALCRVSHAHAPLIADSLLNFMSGIVRSNTLRVVATTAHQPILLLTGSDLEALTEINSVEELAGATYTLTGQWQHVSEDGDVIHQHDPRQVALLCTCGPREYCNICERVGHRTKPRWIERQV